MTQDLVPGTPAGPLNSVADRLPSMVAGADARTSWRFVDFFAVTIRNPNTRESYYRAVSRFLDWCEERGLNRFDAVHEVHFTPAVYTRDWEPGGTSLPHCLDAAEYGLPLFRGQVSLCTLLLEILLQQLLMHHLSPRRPGLALGKGLLESPVRPAEARLYGPFGAARRSCNLRYRELVEVSENQNLPMVGGELLQGLSHTLGPLHALSRLLRSFVVARNSNRCLQRHSLHLLLSIVPSDLIQQDLQHPCSETAVRSV